jgi:transposase
MREIEDVLRLHHECGRSNREIARAVRVSPSTVADYLRRTRLAGLTWPLADGLTERAIEAALFPVQPASAVKRPEPDWAAVHRQLGRCGVTLDLLWQDYLGGVPELLVPDNLKSGVTHPSFYEPDLNPSYQEFATHYGLAILPARVRKPRDKAKVEAGVLLAQRWILARLRHQRFFSLAEVNGAIRPLLADLNQRPFKKLPGSRQSVFQTVDRPALKPLPLTRYAFAEWKVARVGIDYHVELERHYYSVPYQYARQQVDLRFTVITVEVFTKGERIASHLRSAVAGRHTTVATHLAPAHQQVAGWNTQRFLDWATTIGVQTLAAITHVLQARTHPQQGYRTALGILRLATAYDPARLEAACQRAIQLNAVTYRSIASLLKHGLEQQADAPAQATLPTDHANVRGSAYYH